MDEITEKNPRLKASLAQLWLDALYLSQLSNFAWITGEAERVVMINSDRADAGLLITQEKRLVICSPVEARDPRIPIDWIGFNQGM